MRAAAVSLYFEILAYWPYFSESKVLSVFGGGFPPTPLFGLFEMFKKFWGWELLPTPVSHPRCIKKGTEAGASTDSSQTLFF